jgi:WD40 repeat protein
MHIDRRRFLHIAKDPSSTGLYASDSTGIVSLFDSNLNLQCSSRPMACVSSIYMIALDDQSLFARDMNNYLHILDKGTLSYQRTISLREPRTQKNIESQVDPIPTASHGLHIIGNWLFCVDGFGDILVFNRTKLKLKAILTLGENAFLESLCSKSTSERAIILSDTKGFIYEFNLDDLCNTQKDIDFQVHNFLPKVFLLKSIIRLDHAPIHKVIFDKKNDRVFATCDAQGGFAAIDTKCRTFKRIKFTNDCTEWIALSQNLETIAASCFDHFLHLFENNSEITPKRKIGPFKFQLKQCEWCDDDCIKVLLESGEIIKVDSTSGKELATTGGTDCIWDICNLNDAGNKCIVAAHEDGFLSLLSINLKGLPQMELLYQTKDFGFGRIRRLASQENVVFCATTTGTIFKIEDLKTESISWKYSTNSIVREISLSRNGEHLFAVCESGLLAVICTKTGFVKNFHIFDKPVWAVANDDEYIYISTRILLDSGDNCESKIEHAQFLALNKASLEVEIAIPFYGNIKRIRPLQNNQVLICGNGEVSARLLDVKKRTTISDWSDFQINTAEDVHFGEQYVRTITYGYQFNSYQIDGTCVASQFVFESYPKVIFEPFEASPFLITAGRTATLSLFDTSKAEVALLESIHLQSTKGIKKND